MNLKNYSSSVPIDRTVGRIEELLAKAGANGIVKEYKEGKIISLAFRVTLPQGKVLAIRLPANEAAVYDSLKRDIKKPHYDTLDRLKDQAGRTAWKLMQDWVEVQISLIQMQQVDFLQVFLPYVWDGQRTFYAALKEKNYLAIPEAT